MIIVAGPDGKRSGFGKVKFDHVDRDAMLFWSLNDGSIFFLAYIISDVLFCTKPPPPP